MPDIPNMPNMLNMRDMPNMPNMPNMRDSSAISAEQAEEVYKALREELIGHYRKELAFIYTYHAIAPIEYYISIKEVVVRLIPYLKGQNLHDVLAACWREAWQREPVCHPNDFL